METSAALTRRRTGRDVRGGGGLSTSRKLCFWRPLPYRPATRWTTSLVSDNFGETPMSSVRCSMRVLNSVYARFCPRRVWGTGLRAAVKAETRGRLAAGTRRVAAVFLPVKGETGHPHSGGRQARRAPTY
eukprot:scaffold17428_cov39-Phaeocystis_antarctica.AAC.2